MNVETLMSRQPKAVLPTDSMNHAAQLMWDHDVGSVPVVDDEQRVIGMLTDRDICMAAYTQNRPLTDISVAEAMSRPVHACRPTDPISKAERLMADKQVRRLPVIDAGERLVGFVSMSDLAQEADREVPLSRKTVTADQVAATLAATSKPRPGTALSPADN